MATLDEIQDDVQILFEQFYSTKLPKFLNIFDKAINVYFEIDNENIGIYPTNSDDLFVKVDYKKLNIPNYIFNKGAESLKYFTYKNDLNKRQMAIPNPIWYFAFVYNIIQLNDFWLEKFYHENRRSLSHSNSPILGRQNFLRLSYDEEQGAFFEQTLAGLTNEQSANKAFPINQEKTMSMEGANPLYLKTDIESYFDSIYTHQFDMLKKVEPFKSEIKSYPKIAYFFDFLDMFNMSINDNHTKGIIQGPISSSISAEFLGIYMDFEITKFHSNFVRYVDDFTFFDKDSSKLDKALEGVDKVFRKVGVRRNQGKTEISKGFPKVKKADFPDLLGRFKFLDKNNCEELSKKDLLVIRDYLQKLYEEKNIPQIRSFLTNFQNYLDRTYKNIKFDIKQSIYLIPLLLKLIFVFPVVASHIYRTFECILLKSSKKEKEHVLSILKQNRDYVDSSYSDTDIQIWHYYLLGEFLNSADRKIILKDFLHTNYLEKYTVDSIIISFFVKKDFKENCKIFDYIETIYGEENEQKTLKGIGASRWWIVLFRLYEYFKDDKIISKYKSISGNSRRQFFDYKNKVYEPFEKSKKPNYSELGVLFHLI